MNRRDFIRHIALLAAGAAALPEQVAAFDAYYTKNSPLLGEPLICIDDLFVNGLATCSSPVRISLFSGDECVLPVGINAFGGWVRWVAAPDQKIVVPYGAKWQIDSDGRYDDEWVQRHLAGSVSYIDQDGLRVRRPIDALEGYL